MTEPHISVAPCPPTVPLDGKWIPGISAIQPVGEVAGRVLDSRLKAVVHWLPLAAERSAEDPEYVHQLRVAARRAMEALRMFGGLLPSASCDSLRARVAGIRLAADEARDWDVLHQRLLRGAHIVPAPLLNAITARRREAQAPVLSVFRECHSQGCCREIDLCVQQVAARRDAEAPRPFARQAPQYLRPVAKKFFKAAESDLDSAESFHRLRIRIKKLRYTMELVAVAFAPDFRKRLYGQVSAFQELLGTVNDHATTKTLFRQRLPPLSDPAAQAFVEGLLLAEEKAGEDLRTAFLATWTTQAIAELKRQFHVYC